LNIAALNNIFSVDAQNMEQRCLEVFRFQYNGNIVYRQWCDVLGVQPAAINTIAQIPFLPISFFKTHTVVTGTQPAEVLFESSGTTQTVNSRHYVSSAALYRDSFMAAFRQFYGEPGQYCILALLPSYLERGQSSLVYMVDELVRQSGHADSGFYLYEHAQLAAVIQRLEAAGQRVILFGVTYALLDFAEAWPMALRHTTIIETGGMKGRKKEMTRAEVHAMLGRQWQTGNIHSEYSMTELLSQAYAREGGRFYCPPWMRVMVRSEDDPLAVEGQGRGVINIIDLANVYSCAFIATDDAGILHADGSFEVLGRVDNSDIRGCSLLTV